MFPSLPTSSWAARAPHTARRTALSIALLAACAGLASCGDKNKAPRAGQALVSVNGEEITTMQLNEELQRANVLPAQQQAASRQLLDGLIDRQLLQNEAAKEKLDRDPKVMQAVERARSLIVAQAYMQKKIGAIDKPSGAEVRDYYTSNPDFFANRKQFDMKQLVIETKDLTEQAKQAADGARSLDALAAWFDANKVKYLRTQASRTTSDLTPEISAKLKSMAPGQLFVVKEGPRSMFISIAEIKDNPASLEIAAPQIEKFLMNKRGKELAEAELRRLRGIAKIDYINKDLALAATSAVLPAGAPGKATASAVSNATANVAGDDATARGVAGLK
ncbi:MAG: peptidyl-prolyl cis-trans isomerase, EpsD family [Massilia sp.]|nr:peptidyl-prolyl cis-trans isomerase, EpsD family [Massilia sp.]